MSTTATQFALSIPSTEEDIHDCINEIIRLHGYINSRNKYAIKKEDLANIRDNLLCVVEFINEKLDK